MSLAPGAKNIPWIDGALCLSCRQCLARAICRTKAIRSIDRDEPPFIDAHLCMGCHECVAICPAGAIIVPVVAPMRK